MRVLQVVSWEWVRRSTGGADPGPVRADPGAPSVTTGGATSDDPTPRNRPTRRRPSASRLRWPQTALAIVSATMVACAGGADGGPTPSAPARPTASALLDVDSSWYWQLQGTPPTPPFDLDVYDLDLFETEPETVAAIHDAGRLLICYFSAGSYESWRPDVDGFTDDDLGATLDGFEDERWLDIGSESVRSVMLARLDLAVELGCDGVEPDNVTAYVNDTGFDLTSADQLDFNRFLAAAAHDRGLLVGLKNDLDQIPELVGVFDFAVNEQCHEYDECELNAPFLAAGKPVFNAEYADDFVDDPTLICDRAVALGLRTLILPIDLDGSFRISCDDV